MTKVFKITLAPSHVDSGTPRYIVLCFRSLKQSALSCSSFNISQHISFSSNATRSGSHSKLVQPFVKTNRYKNFYFNRLPHLWNALPPIDLQLKAMNQSRSSLPTLSELIRSELGQRLPKFIPLLLSCCKCSLPVSKYLNHSQSYIVISL